MINILHLTDIHIGKDQNTDDVKLTGLLDPKYRHQRFRSYCATLHALEISLTAQNKNIDAIVISGDITVQYKEDGFVLFEKLLESLGRKRPKNNKILVLPGNHDVKWFLNSNDKAKYELFLKYIRKEGYVTPFLDEVDNGKKRKILINFPDSKICLVPINTSHFCGSLQTFNNEANWVKAKDILENASYLNNFKEIIKEIEGLRIHDISKVSTIQLEFISNEIQKLPHETALIAVGHHPISPVSYDEEFKTFETLTNLGELRSFLFEHNFKMLLHGHKHKQITFWDYLFDYTKIYNDNITQKPLLIVSGSQLSDNGASDKDICRLIEISNDSSPCALIKSFHATHAPGKLVAGETKKYYFSSNNTSLNKFICGKNIEEVYSKILDLPNEYFGATHFNNVICEVSNPGNKIIVPNLYFHTKTKEEVKIEIDKTVDWWSKADTELKNVHYTHGQRLYKFGENKRNQIEMVRDALAAKHDTSKAIAVLINPDTDGIDDQTRSPHFSSIQFTISKNGTESLLNCIAYFRKQEMRQWWLVNIAEIIRLQNEVIQSLNTTTEKDVKYLKIGSITTISAIAYIGNENARTLVAIPEIDRMFDDDKTNNTIKLTHLVYSLIHTTVRQDGEKQQWHAILSDMIPESVTDPNGSPIAIDGLEFVIRCIEDCLKSLTGRKTYINRFLSKLKELLSRNRLFYSLQQKKVYGSDYKKWSDDTTKIVIELLKILNKLF